MPTRSITSKDNPLLKAVRALVDDPREQRAKGRAVLDGPHLIEACWRQRITPEHFILSETGSRNQEIMTLIARYPQTDVVQIPDHLLRGISPVVTPVGVLAVIRIPASGALPATGSCLVLDAIQDAGNVGTMLRTAAAAGIRAVALGPGCANAWSPKVLRAAQGAHFCMNIHEEVDLAALLRGWQGTRIAAVAANGVSLFAASLPNDIAWVFGNEGAGVSATLTSLADICVTIPLAAETESLNVAAAAAVCLFEQVRQRPSA